jgi:hypothetical protein
VELKELLKKFRRREPQDEEDERSSDDVNKSFAVSSGEAPASWIPSQQDRPRH